jgi:CHAT domain-containing protein
MPTTPGQVGLQGVQQEAMQVQKAVEDCLAVRHVACPEAKEVLACMSDYDVVHFACHGLSDPVDPSESGLILQRRESPDVEPLPDRLMVRQISGLHLKNACIAFLSACSTAQNKVRRLADEVIHLASGFQVAGFAHMIGSMWPSVDDICAAMAKGFYGELMVRGWNKISNRDVALALHQSIISIRSCGRNRGMPLSWAQYVHVGA